LCLILCSFSLLSTMGCSWLFLGRPGFLTRWSGSSLLILWTGRLHTDGANSPHPSWRQMSKWDRARHCPQSSLHSTLPMCWQYSTSEQCILIILSSPT
jgi:hypothetical protein